MTTIFTSWPTLRIVQLNLNWPQNTKLCQDHTWIQMKRCSPQKEHDDICWYKYPLKSWLSLVAKLAIVLIWYSHIFWYFFESSLISQHWACFFRVFSLQPPTNIHICRQNIPLRYFIRFWWQRQMTSDREVSVTHRPAWDPFDKQITCSWSFLVWIEFLKLDEIRIEWRSVPYLSRCHLLKALCC